MTELPDLPPVPRIHRPLVPGGAEAAMARGARRRNRILASAGGATTALALVLVATVSLPGERDDSLGIAERPTPERVVPLSPEQSPPPTPDTQGAPPSGEVPAASSPPGAPGTARPKAPAPGTTAGVLPEQRGGGADGSASTAPRSTGTDGSTSQPAAGRPAYREDTDEDGAGSAFCAPGQTTSDGANMAGAAAGSGCAYGRSSGSLARRGEQFQVVHGECSSSGSTDTLFSFGSGREKELVVTRDGQEVFRFSSTVRYVEGPHQRRLRGGRCIEWTGRWDLVDTSGRPVPAGTYRVTLTVEADRVEPEGAPDLATEPYRQTNSLEVTVLD